MSKFLIWNTSHVSVVPLRNYCLRDVNIKSLEEVHVNYLGYGNTVSKMIFSRFFLKKRSFGVFSIQYAGLLSKKLGLLLLKSEQTLKLNN